MHWFLSVVAASSALLSLPVGASKLTPPVLPLTVRNPYFSTWLGDARVTPWNKWPMFWTGEEVWTISPADPSTSRVPPEIHWSAVGCQADVCVCIDRIRSTCFCSGQRRCIPALGKTTRFLTSAGTERVRQFTRAQQPRTELLMPVLQIQCLLLHLPRRHVRCLDDQFDISDPRSADSQIDQAPRRRHLLSFADYANVDPPPIYSCFVHDSVCLGWI